MGLLLTAEERARFASWLELEAESGEAMAIQMEKMPGPVMVELIKRERAEALAARVIAKKLRSIEDVSL